MSRYAASLERLAEVTMDFAPDEFVHKFSGTENVWSLGRAYKLTPVIDANPPRNNVEVVEYRAYMKLESIDSLPADVQNKLDVYLANWVGKTYKSILNFKHAYVFDIDEIHSKDPDSLNYQWEIPKYSFSYCVNLPGVVPCYVAGLEMRGDGTILKDINLPPLSIHPDRMKLLSEAEVFKTALKQNFYPDIPFNNHDFSISGNLGYSRRAERFLYSFSKTTEQGSGSGAVTNFYYDAQTGKYWGYAISRWIN